MKSRYTVVQPAHAGRVVNESIVHAVAKQQASFEFYPNTCWATHFEISPKRFTTPTLTLLFASEQAHCALVVCDSESASVALQEL